MALQAIRNFFGWQTYPHYLQFTYYPNPDYKKDDEVEWEARLEVRANDVPLLMRQGFHWSAANVCEEESYFLTTRLDLQLSVEESRNWKVGRIYTVVDLQKPPQWTARLVVFAQKVSVLSAFRIQMLSPDKTISAFARNSDENLIYEYYYHHPTCNYNSIYDDKLLGGWWPRPKKQEQEGKGQEEQGQVLSDEENEAKGSDGWNTEWSQC
ncbi:hypothetical protein PT974_09822 [Cladobotryum mycophilum]|uniref:Uncharacterized protein n=1 Tax=Cladobotryum mycophilum TaxID=491253 RepID=A0ABR0SH91_9HYPO